MRFALLLTVGLFISFSARADLIFGVLPGANTTSLTGANSCSTGPTTATVAGFAISTTGAACLPYTGWDFGRNGEWDRIPAVSDFSGTTTITINLGGSYSSVWGQIDYYLNCDDTFGSTCSYFGNDPTITALDVNMNVLESVDLVGLLTYGSTDDFDYNAGTTIGLSQPISDIAYLQIGGDFIAISDISVESNSPEPATLAISGLGLAAIGLIPRRRRKTLDVSGRDLPTS